MTQQSFNQRALSFYFIYDTLKTKVASVMIITAKTNHETARKK